MREYPGLRRGPRRLLEIEIERESRSARGERLSGSAFVPPEGRLLAAPLRR